jgi:hypothetical protein
MNLVIESYFQIPRFPKSKDSIVKPFPVIELISSSQIETLNDESLQFNLNR